MLRRLLVVLLATVAVGAPTAAHATTPPDPVPAETAPPATDPPAQPEATAPPTPATTDPAVGDDAGSGIDWVPIVLIVGGILALLVVLGALFGRSKQPPAAPASTKPLTPSTPAAPSPQASLLSTAQWIHDQLSLELMAASPASARQRWATERSRLDNVAIGAQAEFAGGADPYWQGFGQSVSSLATALDTNLQLRAQDPPNVELIGESTDVVNRHRSALQQWINTLRPTI
jgi:hypothetical protein